MPVSGSNIKQPADYLVAAREAETLALEHLLQMVRLVVAISNLVHALQRERGASGIYVSSAGQRFAAQRDALIQVTDAEQEILFSTLSAIDQHIGPLHAGTRLLNRLANALQQLEHLAPIRQQVQAQRVTPDDARRFYTELIGALLAVVFDAADTAPDPDITRALVAMFHFMQGKELAGQERAIGGMRLAGGQYSKAFSEQLAGLIEGQERCFETFASFADPQSLATWQQAITPENLQQLEKFRRIIGLPPTDQQRDASLSEDWFNCASQRMDAMKVVEDAIEQHLREISESRLEEARQAWNCYREWAAARHQGDNPAPPADGHGNAPEPANMTLADHEANPPAGLNRSVLELVEQQTRRLQSMQEELEQARAALEERKLVDRAKALLMKHRKMSEDEAHRLLRKMAMNQSRRLADVARTLLAMSDVLE